MRVWKSSGLRIAAVLGIICLAAGSAYGARFIGFDGDESGGCVTNTGDMGRWHGAGDVGTDFTFDIIIEELDDAMIGYGCTFCVKDTTALLSYGWAYDDHTPWSATPINSQGAPISLITVSESIRSAYPRLRCWVIQETDFTGGTAPLSAPFTCGTFTYQVAGEGSIQFLIDGPNTAAFLQTGMQVEFDGTGEVCPENTGTEETSWGSIKQLFR